MMPVPTGLAAELTEVLRLAHGDRVRRLPGASPTAAIGSPDGDAADRDVDARAVTGPIESWPDVGVAGFALIAV